MRREYLDEILEGKKTYDARTYDTNIRGTIALVDTKKSSIIGLIDLIGVHKINADDFCKWHATGKWAGLDFKTNNIGKKYYAYDFKNPRRLPLPIKIIKNGKVWTKLDDNVVYSTQLTLF